MAITLKEILSNKKREVEKRYVKEGIRLLRKKVATLAPSRDFKKAISGRSLVAIAEIKRKSPSAGSITKLDVIKIAREYERNRHCSAISVLTDKKFFGGDIKLLEIVKRETSKPVLQKDFIIDEYQIYEARAYGADAILLIAGILTKKRLKRFFEIARDLLLACLIESHTIEDLKKIPSEAKIYGINNRDLRDFSVDLNTTRELIEHIPEGKIIVVESGIETKKDIDFIKSLKRVNAALIGTSILKTPHPGRALDRLF